MWNSTPSLLRENLQVLRFLTVVNQHARVEFMERLCPTLSYQLQCGFYLFCLMCTVHSARLQIFFKEEIVLQVTVYSVCLQEEESLGSSYHSGTRTSALLQFTSISRKELIHSSGAPFFNTVAQRTPLDCLAMRANTTILTGLSICIHLKVAA